MKVNWKLDVCLNLLLLRIGLNLMFATGRPPSAMEAPIGIPPIFGIRLTCLTEDAMLWKGYIICLLVTKFVNISEIIRQALQSTSQKLCTIDN